MFVALLTASSTIFGQKIETTVVSFDPVFEDREVARKPGTLLFESGKFKLQNNYNTVTARGLNLKLPKDTKEAARWYSKMPSCSSKICTDAAQEKAAAYVREHAPEA